MRGPLCGRSVISPEPRVDPGVWRLPWGAREEAFHLMLYAHGCTRLPRGAGPPGLTIKLKKPGGRGRNCLLSGTWKILQPWVN